MAPPPGEGRAPRGAPGLQDGDMNEEPKRDPVLREALLHLEGEATLRDQDAERLQQAILWRAAGPLARLRERRSRTWRDYLARWAGGLVPAAVVAAVML